MCHLCNTCSIQGMLHGHEMILNNCLCTAGKAPIGPHQPQLLGTKSTRPAVGPGSGARRSKVNSSSNEPGSMQPKLLEQSQHPAWLEGLTARHGEWVITLTQGTFHIAVPVRNINCNIPALGPQQANSSLVPATTCSTCGCCLSTLNLTVW
jgi:hypothetical protein